MIELDPNVNINDEEDEDGDDERELSPSQRIGHVAVKYNNSILVWGGYKESINSLPKYLPTTKLWLYDQVIEKWSCLKTKKEDSPVGVSGSCALLHNDTLFVFGGFCDETRSAERHTNEIYSLNLRNLTWHLFDCGNVKPLPCDKMVGWVHEGRLYYFGGFGMPPYSSDLSKKCDFCYDTTSVSNATGWNNQLVMFDPKLQGWTWPLFDGPPPKPRAAHAVAKVGSKVYVFGGRHKGVRMNDLHCLDLKLMRWSGSLTMKGSLLPVGRSWHSLTPISENHIILYGGFTSQQEALSDCWMLQIPELIWTKIDLPSNKPRLWHTACEGDQGEVVIFGGCVGNILSPRLPAAAEDIITLWFSPKSLLRLCLDYNVKYKKIFEHSWPTLPPGLQKLLQQKSSESNRVRNAVNS